MADEKPIWFYDETRQVGVDFNSPEEVEKYDADAARIRKAADESAYIAESISLKSNQTILEIGCGTGEITLELAGRCRKVIAADVSPRMLEYAATKARTRGVANIEFVHAGFLSLDRFRGEVDAIATEIALHHLPEFWKMIAIKNMHDILRPGGKLFLRDSILSFEINDFVAAINGYIELAEKYAGSNKARELILNIREEYPSLSWVLEGMLLRAGFAIDFRDLHNGYFATFICTRK